MRIPRKLYGTALAASIAVAASACTSAPARVDDAVQAESTTPAHCVRETGTRLPVDNRTCRWGRVIEREEIQRTGAFSIGEALNRLGVR